MIGSNYHHDGLRALASPDEVFAAAAAGYAERSPDGANHFGEVLDKTLAMWSSEPELTVDELRSIGVPALVMVGDDDAIELSHSCSLYESIPGAQFAVVPGTSHALPIERPDETARIIEYFLRSVLPPTTLMPIDRAKARPATS
jgi:pimeloyl-ACP methyl ester carboxylesterase